MKRFLVCLLIARVLFLLPTPLCAKDLPKIAVWDLVPRETKATYAQELTSILVSEISKLEKYEVYSQENVRTLTGWTAERMTLGCTDTKCLTALGQMDIAKLISGSVGKIGNRYSVSLNLFDTQNARAEKSVSAFCRSEDELIELVQYAIMKLLGVEVARSKPEEKGPEKAAATFLAEYGKSFKDSVTGMEFVFVKGGYFEMGDTFGDGEPDEKPVHEVCLDDFYVGVYKVTWEQWEKVMGRTFKKGDSFRYIKRGGHYPVVARWNEVEEFIRTLNRQSGQRYRLLTEAEWEYAARCGREREKFAGTSGEKELDQYAWYAKNSSGRNARPVEEKNSSGLGPYGMCGNVWESCADWFDGNYYKRIPRNNPGGPDNANERVIRGGDCSDDFMRVSNRAYADPLKIGLFSVFEPYTGFRLALYAW